MNLDEVNAMIKKLTAKKLGKPNQVKDYEGTIDDSIFGSKVKVKAKSQASAEKKVKKMASYKDRNSGLKRTWPNQTSEVPKYQDVRDTYKKHEIKEETQIEKGVKDEMEHTKSKKVARKIAKDHLKKHSDYYSKLEKAGLDEGKWNYPKDMTKTKETSDMGTTNAAQNRKDRKAWRKKVKKEKLKEATLGGAKLAGKANPNNVKSKKSGFTINTKMNDAYSKVPDAKGLVRKRLLQKGKAAWNVGHAKKMAEAKETPEESKKKWDEMMKRIKHTREVTAHAGKMPKKKEDLHEVSKALLTRYMKGAKHQVSNTVVSDSKFEKRMDGMVAAGKKLRKKKLAEENLQELSKKTLRSYISKATDDATKKSDSSKAAAYVDAKKTASSLYKKAKSRFNNVEKAKEKLKEGLKTGDYGHEKEKKDLAWRKRVQKEYDGPNREGKSADDGVRYTGD
jgi:hypothetical protein